MGQKLYEVDVLAGALLAGAGGYIIYTALQLDYVNEFGPGPGFLPLWLGIGLLALATVMIVLTVVQPRRNQPQTGSWMEPLRRGLTAWVAFMIFIASVDRLGFFLTFTFLTFFLAWVLSERPAWISLLVALSSALTFHIVFSWGLGLALPEGPLGF
jgi:putative tricarboxylic transport membrane protein